MSITTKKKSWQPTMDELVREIIIDLPGLFEQFPDGVMFTYLSKYYGESSPRISSAASILVSRGKARIMKMANKSQYIVHPTHDSKSVEPLSQRQQDLIKFVQNNLLDRNKGYVITNYTQLARLLKSSYGGMKLRVQRLAELGYLEIVHESEQGKTDALHLKLGPNSHDSNA